MKRLWNFIKNGDWHLHHWIIHERIDIFQTNTSKIPCATRYICQCTVCGHMKKFEF